MIVAAWAALTIPAVGTTWASHHASPRPEAPQKKANGSPGKQLPSFAPVEKTVEAQLAKTPGYQRADLLSKRDARPIFPQLANIGWKVADQKDILEQLLDDNHVLVQELRTPEGLKFMRSVSGQAGIFDRLDRLSQDEHGTESIRTLIRLPEEKLFGKVTPRSQVSNMSELVQFFDRGAANRAGLKDPDKPTGMVYTADALLKRLRQSYQQAAAVRPSR